MRLTGMRSKDPTEDMLQRLYEKLTFKSWHFGHFHLSERVDKFECHYTNVRMLGEYDDRDNS